MPASQRFGYDPCRCRQDELSGDHEWIDCVAGLIGRLLDIGLR